MSLRDFLALLLKAGAKDEDIEEGMALWKQMHANGASEPDPQPDPKPARKARKPRKVRGPDLPKGKVRHASTLPLKDWVTLTQAAHELSVPADQLARIIEEHGLAIRRYIKADALVHVRQIAYWLERNQVLDVDQRIFDEWPRAVDAARQFGIDASWINRLVEKNWIGCYRPSRNLNLVNEADLRRYLKKRG